GGRRSVRDRAARVAAAGRRRWPWGAGPAGARAARWQRLSCETRSMSSGSPRRCTAGGRRWYRQAMTGISTGGTAALRRELSAIVGEEAVLSAAADLRVYEC